MKEKDPSLPALKDLESTIDVDVDRLWADLLAKDGDLAELYAAGVTVAAVDGKIDPKEVVLLKKLAEVCGVEFAPDVVKRKARERMDAGV